MPHEIVIDLETNTMIHGRKIFEDGPVVPFCKLQDGFTPSIRVNYIPMKREPYKWKASDIIANRETSDGRPVYVLQDDNLIIGILDGYPCCWFKDGRYRMDDKFDERDLK